MFKEGSALAELRAYRCASPAEIRRQYRRDPDGAEARFQRDLDRLDEIGRRAHAEGAALLDGVPGDRVTRDWEAYEAERNRAEEAAFAKIDATHAALSQCRHVHGISAARAEQLEADVAAARGRDRRDVQDLRLARVREPRETASTTRSRSARRPRSRERHAPRSTRAGPADPDDPEEPAWAVRLHSLADRLRARGGLG